MDRATRWTAPKGETGEQDTPAANENACPPVCEAKAPKLSQRRTRHRHCKSEKSPCDVRRPPTPTNTSIAGKKSMRREKHPLISVRAAHSGDTWAVKSSLRRRGSERISEERERTPSESTLDQFHPTVLGP